MTAIDHTTKRATRHELLRTARVLRDRSKRLAALATSLNHQADELELEARGEGGVVLGGRKITETLERFVPHGAEAHYTELEAILVANGYVAGGVQPAETLLAALARSPAWRRVGKRSGIYKRVVPRRAGRRRA